jgi:hypothetical protein
MVDFITKSVNSRMITAFFDTREAAQRASDSLTALGVRAHQIQITDGASNPDAAGAAQPAEMSFWESLKSMFLPAEDHHSYAEGLQRGGYLLSADVDPELYDRAVEVVDSGGAVNMDEREASWASSGWTRYESGETSPPPRTPPAVPSPRDTLPTFDEGAVFATRDTSHGRTGLRSYMYGIRDQERAAERFASEDGRIEDHMDVIASDGIKIGTVDHLDGENIKLAKSTSPDGMHHLVSLADVDHVDAHVHLNRTSPEVRASW